MSRIISPVRLPALWVGVSLLVLMIIAGFVSQARVEGAGASEAGLVANDGTTFPSQPTTLHYLPAYRGTGLVPSAASESAIEPAERGGSIGRDFGINSVIGDDERTQVKNYLRFPNRAIASIKFTLSDGDYLCTAFFIGPDTLVTAGHCVYDPYLNEWASKIVVFPGRNVNRMPFGKANSKKLYSTQCWVENEAPECDYGAIKIDKPLGYTVGWFGIGWKGRDSALLNHTVNVRGYPGDKNPYGSLWTMAGPLEQLTRRQVGYSIDTYAGQSGSPVYGEMQFGEGKCKPCALGVHAYGEGVYPFITRNSGARITKSVFENLVTWRAR